MDTLNHAIITLANWGDFKYVALSLTILLVPFFIVLGIPLMQLFDNFRGCKIVQAGILGAGAILATMLVGILTFVMAVVTYVPPSEGRSNYVTQEHGLAALNNDLDSTTTKETNIGFFKYVSKTTVDDEIVYNVILEVEDENGREYLDLRTLNEADVRIYQDNTMEPKMVEHYSHEKVLNEVTGEWYYIDEQFEYIELVVPEGSVVENYTIDASNM